VMGMMMNAAGIRPFVPGVTVVALIHCCQSSALARLEPAQSLCEGEWVCRCPLPRQRAMNFQAGLRG
jgi:hypothetical protein